MATTAGSKCSKDLNVYYELENQGRVKNLPVSDVFLFTNGVFFEIYKIDNVRIRGLPSGKPKYLA